MDCKPEFSHGMPGPSISFPPIPGAQMWEHPAYQTDWSNVEAALKTYCSTNISRRKCIFIYIYIWGNVACTYSIHFFYIFIHSIHIYYTFINTHNAQAVQIYTTEIVIAESRISPLVSEKAGDSRFGCRYSHLFSLLMKNLDVKL